MVCTLGLPRTTPTDVRRRARSTTGRSPAATASKASSQVASRSSPSRRTSGVRSRSGSASSGAEGGALRADEALAEHVVPVAAGAGDPGPLDGEGESAGGLAEGADTQGGAGSWDMGPPGAATRWRAGWAATRRLGTGRAYRPSIPTGTDAWRGAVGRRGSAVGRRSAAGRARLSPAPAPDRPAAAPGSRR